jgi:hypothetical protein
VEPLLVRRSLLHQIQPTVHSAIGLLGLLRCVIDCLYFLDCLIVLVVRSSNLKRDYNHTAPGYIWYGGRNIRADPSPAPPSSYSIQQDACSSGGIMFKWVLDTHHLVLSFSSTE